jgi:hypothetical protein
VTASAWVVPRPELEPSPRVALRAPLSRMRGGEHVNTTQTDVSGERLQGLGAVLKRCAGKQVVGNVQLSEKFAAASALMKRDIVFAASLYLEA